VEGVAGQLTDFYDPRTKSIHLSESSTGRPSVAAMAVVAHELGHAEQDKVGSSMLRLRSALVPAANIGSNLGIWIVILGLIMGIAAPKGEFATLEPALVRGRRPAQGVDQHHDGRRQCPG
jgi:Zn-dependent membrane protease YugP